MLLPQEQGALQVAIESVKGVQHAFCAHTHTHTHISAQIFTGYCERKPKHGPVASGIEGRPGLLPSQKQSFCLNVF